MRLGKSLADNLICSKERNISSPQGCRSSDRVISCDCLVASPSPKKGGLAWEPLLLWLSLFVGHVSRRYPRLWPLEDPTVFPMRCFSFTSRTCLARSSPKRNFAEAFVSEEQRAWYSGFKAGFICSRRKRDISLAACPIEATISILLVSSSFLVGPFKSVTRSNVSTFVKVAYVAFWKACCKLASRRSAFFQREFKDCQISELARVTVISSQFSGGSYLVKRLDIFSWSSFLPQRLLATSANYLLIGGPFLSSSRKVAVNSFRISSWSSAPSLLSFLWKLPPLTPSSKF